MADFAGFCGPAYEAPSLTQNAAECINWRAEVDPTKAQGERGRVALYPTPGLILKAQPSSGEVRGLHPIQGGTVLLAIIGNTLWSIDSTYAPTNRGTLTTTNGRVSITDNGQAAYFCDGPNRYTYTYAGNAFATVAASDGPFTGGSSADVVDGFIIYVQPNSQNWGATSLNSTVSPALSVGKKDGSPDNLVRLIVNNREVFLLGEYTGETWVDVGGFPFPFQRIPGTSMQHGCAAPDSVSRLGNSFAFVSKDDRGQGIIVAMNGYSPVEISTHAVTNSIANQTISDARAFTYQLEGHECYVVTFPSIDITWVYDAATQFWHKWLSIDSFGVYHRHRGNCQAVFQGLSLVGDFENGSIYALDNNTFTENGNPIRRLRRSPHLVSDYNQVFYARLQIGFQPGIGLTGNSVSVQGNVYADGYADGYTDGAVSVTVGADPQAILRWSNDGGMTYSNEHWRSVGQIGKYQARAIWRRLGNARDRVFEVSVTDPVKFVIISADLDADAGDN